MDHDEMYTQSFLPQSWESIFQELPLFWSVRPLLPKVFISLEKPVFQLPIGIVYPLSYITGMAIPFVIMMHATNGIPFEVLWHWWALVSGLAHFAFVVFLDALSAAASALFSSPAIAFHNFAAFSTFLSCLDSVALVVMNTAMPLGAGIFLIASAHFCVYRRMSAAGLSAGFRLVMVSNLIDHRLQVWEITSLPWVAYRITYEVGSTNVVVVPVMGVSINPCLGSQ